MLQDIAEDCTPAFFDVTRTLSDGSRSTRFGLDTREPYKTTKFEYNLTPSKRCVMSFLHLTPQVPGEQMSIPILTIAETQRKWCLVWLREPHRKRDSWVNCCCCCHYFCLSVNVFNCLLRNVLICR